MLLRCPACGHGGHPSGAQRPSQREICFLCLYTRGPHPHGRRLYPKKCHYKYRDDETVQGTGLVPHSPHTPPTFGLLLLSDEIHASKRTRWQTDGRMTSASASKQNQASNLCKDTKGPYITGLPPHPLQSFLLHCYPTSTPLPSPTNHFPTIKVT